jgi:hypothetical protein
MPNLYSFRTFDLVSLMAELKGLQPRGLATPTFWLSYACNISIRLTHLSVIFISFIAPINFLKQKRFITTKAYVFHKSGKISNDSLYY